MLAITRIIALVAVVIVVVYIAIYFTIKLVKPTFVISNDGYVGWYGAIMFPIRYTSTFITEDSDRIRVGEYTFGGCNGYGDKIFYSFGKKTYAAYASNKTIAQLALNLKEGDKVKLIIIKSLESDDAFRDYFNVGIGSMQLIPK